MALLPEEIVEEWLNRQGFFTIRGIKLKVHEIDLLALRSSVQGLECRHFEVQASVRPVSYITRVPKAVQQQTGRSATSAKLRDAAELRQGVREWIAKKYEHPAKKQLRNKLARGRWSRELVVHIVKYEREVELLREEGIVIHRLRDIVADLQSGRFVVDAAAGAHLTELVAMTTRTGGLRRTLGGPPTDIAANKGVRREPNR